MSNVLRKIQRQGRDAGMLPGRTFQRTQGCWNCVHFRTGREVHKFFVTVCKPRDEKVAESYIALGTPEGRKAAGEMRELLKAANAAIKSNGLGMCAIGKPQSDFVAHNYLCEDGWTGAAGASLAREGAKPDLTPGELKDIVDGSNPDGGAGAVEEAASESGLILKP